MVLCSTTFLVLPSSNSKIFIDTMTQRCARIMLPIIYIYPVAIPYHVGKRVINHPSGNPLYRLSMVIWEMVQYCFTPIQNSVFITPFCLNGSSPASHASGAAPARRHGSLVQSGGSRPPRHQRQVISMAMEYTNGDINRDVIIIHKSGI